MIVKTKAIVLSALKFNEKSLIVKCFTLSDGLKSYFVRDAFSGKKNNQKIAYFQPLTLLEIEAVHKNKGTLENFKEIKISQPYSSIPTDIFKSTIVMFLSEMLHHSIHEEEANPDFFSFLETAFMWLDTNDQISNFHLILLMESTKFLGFYPEDSNPNFDFFEMREGVFIPFETVTCLNKSNSFLLKKLLELRFDSAAILFNSKERQELLTVIIDYYALHLDGFRKPKSLEVLVEVFS
ncbi:DNA repair protein RecO [Flavobacterium antarcticum]|uniref:DNA repair protein RecO n=1 Tax=Flavobacterium antarcticum TaxID=271155 RepID=UPI0003B67B81|nr:DNA repair protein RecO [Flavobacterium antarcticum]